MDNVIFGKTMESLRDRINIRLVSTKNDYLKRASKPRYMSHKIFDNGLVAICRSKLALSLNKPAYIRIWILDLSKVLMYK